MSQWGQSRFIRHGNAAIVARPHINTGHAFAAVHGDDLIGEIVVIDILSGSSGDLEAITTYINDRFRTMPYREWLAMPDFPKGGTVLTRDYRPILGIKHDHLVLKADHLWRFEAYDENCAGGVEPWIAVIFNDTITERRRAADCQIFYTRAEDRK